MTCSSYTSLVMVYWMKWVYSSFAVFDTLHDALSATALPANFLREQMNRCYSRRLVLVLDCCYSGAFTQGTKGLAQASVRQRHNLTLVATVTLY